MIGKKLNMDRFMTGATVKKSAANQKDSSAGREYKSVKLVRPVLKPSIPEKDIEDAVRYVRDKHEKRL